jgi:hypothetical protein
VFWELRSAYRAAKDEYLGWRKFKHATGQWPFWSVLSSVLSIPIVFAIGMYCLIASVEARGLTVFYGVLIVVVVCGAAVWYSLRRAACVADVARAKRRAGQWHTAEQLEDFLR